MNEERIAMHRQEDTCTGMINTDRRTHQIAFVLPPMRLRWTQHCLKTLPQQPPARPLMTSDPSLAPSWAFMTSTARESVQIHESACACACACVVVTPAAPLE